MTRVLTLLALTFLTTPAFASDTRNASTEYDFLDGDLVQGDMHTSDVALVTFRRRGARVSLIQTRTAFVYELLKSVENQ